MLDILFWVVDGFTYVDLYVAVLTTLTLSRCIRNLREALIGDHGVSSIMSYDVYSAFQPVPSLSTVSGTVDRELEGP
ncbi:uncharacterized protein FIBRA_07456 [Fibroporia radiculosa]|uniref:Uncharacterized protein n=1 Tax=Fibroporia radiculosa TaxID=599839 RepID=J4IBU0_9APHY|nr:uncharacterized protein FIBRA_07456 [Fibroporia radiculosa]CCM05246.1 predicted protein [Fibroporia radiculosa]